MWPNSSNWMFFIPAVRLIYVVHQIYMKLNFKLDFSFLKNKGGL